jgi:hypothetical protein
MSTSVIEQLNLSPQERRIVVVIAVIVFIVLNFLLVWPHFSDLSKVRAELDQTRKDIESWNKVILKDIEPKTGYRDQLIKLQLNQGGGIGAHQIQLQRTISDQAVKTGVGIEDIRPITSVAQTNQFYEEQSVKISFECQESGLINFLFNVGNDPAMIRVRELNLRTADANRYRLRGDAMLSANYVKQAPVAPAKPAPGAPGKTPAAPPTPAQGPGPGGPPNLKGPPGPQPKR